MLEKLQEALNSGDRFEQLSKIRELIPDEGQNEQQVVVVYAFAVILETNSAGLSILFDRFDDDELKRIELSLERIGAKDTLADFNLLKSGFYQSVSEGMNRNDASDTLQEQCDLKAMDKKTEVHSQEIEECLLAFCKNNLSLLAKGM